MRNEKVCRLLFVVVLAFVSCGNTSSENKTEIKKDSSISTTVNDSIQMVKDIAKRKKDSTEQAYKEHYLDSIKSIHHPWDDTDTTKKIKKKRKQ